MATLHRDWSALEDRLNVWTPPLSAFDPLSAWSLDYTRQALVPDADGTPGGGQAGTLALTLRPGSDALSLRAAEAVQAGFTTLTAHAEMTCASDALLTPRQWSVALSWQGGPLAGYAKGELDQTRGGRAEGAELVFKAAKERRLPAPARWTGFWNLFAAVQRLPFAEASALTFDLFEDLELHKPGQRLAYVGPHSVALKSQTLELHVFEQTGRGMLPWRWWLDAQHRVLLAAGGRRAYLLNPSSKGGAA